MNCEVMTQVFKFFLHCMKDTEHWIYNSTWSLIQQWRSNYLDTGHATNKVVHLKNTV